MTDARAFRGFRFPAEVILWAVRWYLQFPISYRDLERMLADRGVAVDHTTIYRWVRRFAPELEKRLRRHLRPCRGPGTSTRPTSGSEVSGAISIAPSTAPARPSTSCSAPSATSRQPSASSAGARPRQHPQPGGHWNPGVPWQTSLRLAACLESAAVTVELIEDGDHRLSRDEDLRLEPFTGSPCRRLVGPFPTVLSPAAIPGPHRVPYRPSDREAVQIAQARPVNRPRIIRKGISIGQHPCPKGKRGKGPRRCGRLKPRRFSGSCRPAW